MQTAPHGSRDPAGKERSPEELKAGGERPDAPKVGPSGNGASGLTVVRRESVFRRALAVADVVAAGVALLVCVSLLGDDRLTAWAFLALPLVIVAGKAHGLYSRDELLLNKTTLDQTPALFECATLYTLLVVLLQAVFVDGMLGNAQVLVLWGTFLLAGLVTRRAARWIARHVTKVERCLFVGSDASFQRLGAKLGSDDARATLVGRMSITSLVEETLIPAGVSALHRLIDELDVHRVIIEPSEALPQITLDFVREAKTTNVRVSLLPRILEVVGAAIEIDDIDGMTLLGVKRFGLSRSNRWLKRGFDATGALLGLLAAAPFLALISILIKLDTEGPVIFRQTRIGRDGAPFEIWKFRTMVSDADELKAQLQAHNSAAAGLFKIHDDPRITRTGRWLRRTSLDELPQLVNVLKGQMSLVGPRPLITSEDDQITGHDRHRLHLTPGMTGHWQIAGSSRIPLSEMVKLDYLYVANWSLWTDIKILLRTCAYVLARRGL